MKKDFFFKGLTVNDSLLVFCPGMVPAAQVWWLGLSHIQVEAVGALEWGGSEGGTLYGVSTSSCQNPCASFLLNAVLD